MTEKEAQRVELELLLDQIRLLSAEMKVLAAEHAHQKLTECIGQRQGMLEHIFDDFMQYLTEDDIVNISQVLVIDKEVEQIVGDYQQKVRESFEKNKKRMQAHKAYKDQT